MTAGPLYRFDDLERWARGGKAGEGSVDLGLGVITDAGFEGRLRARYGIRNDLSAFGEAWTRWNRTWEAGALVGLEYRW